MTVHVSGRRSSARFALDTVLEVSGLSTDESNDALSLNIAMPDSDTNAPETRLYFGAVSDEVALRFGVRQLGELACSTLRFTCGGPLWTADDLAIVDRFASRDVSCR